MSFERGNELVNYMKIIDFSVIKGAHIGENVTVECDEFINAGDFFIEDNTLIRAKKIILGSNARIEKDTKITPIRGEMDLFIMGDESLIGFNSQIMLPHFVIGDYSRLFSGALCSGYKPIVIGHNCWIGQATILNSIENLTIGNNVRMGGNSQIWTHVASGELLEGCRFYSEKPVVIEDNVWLMGFGHAVSPGVVLAKNTIVMSGSAVTKSTKAFHTYSGSPAIDITDKLNGWNIPSDEEKFLILKGFAREFIEINTEYKNRVHCFDLDLRDEYESFQRVVKIKEPCLIFLKKIDELEFCVGGGHSIFDLSSKYYQKKRSEIEVSWMKFAIGFRARFIPLDCENIAN